MAEPMVKLKNAPIVEAILDIDCDLPPSINIAALESVAHDLFKPEYPDCKRILMQEHRLAPTPEGITHVSKSTSMIQGFQFNNNDQKQVVQVRAQGFTFNRLAPYTAFDDYLPEMERTWKLFVRLASPIQIKAIQLRYINRILLPAPAQKVELADYLQVCPHLPEEDKLEFAGFLNQHAAVEKETGNRVNIILASQNMEPDNLPIIFDISASRAIPLEPESWPEILATIQSLRELKNRIFWNTLTHKCLTLFQQ